MRKSPSALINVQRGSLLQHRRARRARADLVHRVYLVCLVQPNKRDRPDKQEGPVCTCVSRATVCIACGLLQHPVEARGVEREREDTLFLGLGMYCIEKDDSHCIAPVGSG